MNRVSWYTFAPDEDVLGALRDGLIQAEYLQGSASGFRLTRSDSRQVAGQFHERLEYSETITDPFGGQQEVARVDYRTTKFLWLVQDKMLELDNAPRGSGLVARLVQLSMLRCLCASRSLSPLSFARTLLAERSGVVSSISFRDVAFSSRAFASRVDVRGEGLFEDSVIARWIEQRVPVEAASVRLYDPVGRALTMSIAKDGIVRFSGLLAETDRLALRRIVQEQSLTAAVAS